MEYMREILSLGHSLATWSLVGRSLSGILVRVCPVCQTAQTSFIADLARNVREYSIQPDDLAVQFLVCVGNHMVFLIGRHHQVGEALPYTIEEKTTVFALGRLWGLGEFLEKKG
jgi:hypothetical protein